MKGCLQILPNSSCLAEVALLNAWAHLCD
jgi:hypothetical protein